MNLLTSLKNLEVEIGEYCDVAGKDIEQVFAEIKSFIVGKKVEAQNTQAKASNPTTSGPAGVSADSQAAAADSTAGANSNQPPPPKSAA